MPDVFTIYYIHKNFAALKPEKPVTKPGVFDPTIIWSYVGREKLFNRGIDDLRKEKTDIHIDGNITVLLNGLEISGATIGEDFDLIFMDTERGGNQIPSAKFTVEIVFTETLPAPWRRGLLWNSRLVQNFNWEKRISKEFENGLKLAKKIVSDDDYEPSQNEKHIHKEWKKLIGLMEVIDPSFNKDDLDTLKTHFDTITSKLSEYRKLEDENGRIKRGKIANEISELSKRKLGFRSKPPIEIIQGSEELGKYIFMIFRHYMNKVIRFFKYERMQYWMNEISPTEEGFFFIKNKIVWNNASEIVLYGKHNIHLHMLTKDFAYLEKINWENALETIQNDEKLDLYAEGFELGGVFSQAYRAIVESHFEQALVLGILGIESAFRFILEDQEDNPGKVKKEFKPLDKRGKPTTKIYFMIEEARSYFDESMLNIQKGELDSLWTRAQKAREERNDIIHEKKPIKITPENRTKVVEWLDALRRLSYQLDQWRQRTFH